MSVYIRSSSSISPQNTFGQSAFPAEPVTHTGNSLTCMEPDYTQFIEAKSLRRMSRIIRMGVAAAMDCLQQAGVQAPDAIITGTAYGCLEDTEVFLTKMIGNKEELLSPTAFIQSTHNTVGAQIALLLKCHQYNNTFVHRGFSFESALLDAMMLLEEHDQYQVLAGGIDEITAGSHLILERLGLYRRQPVSNTALLSSDDKGTIAGEGAAFFLLTAHASGNDLARLDGMEMFYKPSGNEEVRKNIFSFLEAQGIDIGDISLLITGRNGDRKTDVVYDPVHAVFSQTPLIHYKPLCGEYPSSCAFALWLAANILRQGYVPQWIGVNAESEPLKRILIYNHYLNIHHSLFLVSAC